MIKKKAIGYIRVSTEEQASEGVSVDMQREKIKAYAMLKDLDLVDVIIDAGVSASKALEARAGGSALLNALKNNYVVIAFKLDRLFRNAGDCLKTIEKWAKKNVALHLIDMGGSAVDTTTASGKLFITMLAGFAEFERNTISERTKAAMFHKKQKGERVGSVPYGFQCDGGNLIEDEFEQKTIGVIKNLREEEKLSFRKIVSWLNNSGIAPRGNRWHLSTVQRILKCC